MSHNALNIRIIAKFVANDLYTKNAVKNGKTTVMLLWHPQ